MIPRVVAPEVHLAVADEVPVRPEASPQHEYECPEEERDMIPLLEGVERRSLAASSGFCLLAHYKAIHQNGNKACYILLVVRLQLHRFDEIPVRELGYSVIQICEKKASQLGFARLPTFHKLGFELSVRTTPKCIFQRQDAVRLPLSRDASPDLLTA